MNPFFYTLFGLFSLLNYPNVVTQPQPGNDIINISQTTTDHYALSQQYTNANIQAPPDSCRETFLKTLGNLGTDERGYAIASANDGNIFIAGSRQDSALLIKMDPAGNLIWQRSFLFVNNGNNIISDLKLDSDNFLVGCGVGENGANDRSGFVFRYDPDTNIMLWVQNHQHATLSVFNYDILETSVGGNFLVTGQSHNNSAPGLGCDGYLFELNRNTGTIASVNEHYNLGSCETFQAAQIYNGALYAAGRYNFAGGGTNKMRCGATRFDLSGNQIWSRLYLVDLVANARLFTTDILIENDSIVQIHIGDKDGTSGTNPEIFMSKANLDGELAWAKEYTLPSGQNISLHEIVSLLDGYALLGLNQTDDKLFVLKTDKTGNPIWAKTYGGAVELLGDGTGVEMISKNDNLYITGYSSGFGAGDDDIVVLNVNMDGQINSPCVFIEDVVINVSNFPNPYDGLHPLTAYPSPIGSTNPTITPFNTSLGEEVVCLAACVEICDNGIDDDGDGLIDCYDSDCCESDECSDFYYSGCPADCTFEIGFFPITLAIEWESTGAQDWCSYNTPITGDIDGDGIPEVIGKPCTGASVNGSGAYPNLLIVDGATGFIEAVINTPAFYYLTDGPAIADVDNNGYAEIFIMASDHVDNTNFTNGGPIIFGDVSRRVLCYEYNGSTYVEKWMSTVQAGYTDLQQAMSVSIADFNEDGIPELYLGTQIFNSLTGELIAEGGVSQHHGVKPVGDNASLSQALTVAVDVLPDEFCLNCSGLELVAGGMVFSVGINTVIPANSMINVEVILPGFEDGWTSIADLDKDGDLDAIITTTNASFGIVYCWDIQTASLLYSQYQTPSSNEGFISQANIADFDGDGFPEIGVCSKSHYQVLKPNGTSLIALWEINTDDQSGSTGSCVFDFNNDGASEVVYRGETNLQILDGSTGTILTSLPCASGTRVEYPVAVDVDVDGETEILCSCENTLVAYGSAFIPWLNARPVWNQHNYFNVNINDDLTVPATQQQHHIVGDSIVLNNFLTMYADQDYLAADAVISIDTVTCELGDDFLTLVYQVCNIGDKILRAETPIAMYNADPTSSATATLQLTSALGTALKTGECTNITTQVLVVNSISLFIVVNDDGSLPPVYDFATDFPVTNIPECDYTNNMASLLDTFNIPELDLGPDLQICINGEATLDAGSGFELYEWSTLSNEQSITVTDTGTYYVTAYFGCLTFTDTVIVSIDPDSYLQLGADQIICRGESVTLSVLNGNFDQYQWSPSSFLDCDNCTTVVSTPDSTIEYIVVGMNTDGCMSSDTIGVMVDFEFVTDTIQLCNGESILVFGELVSGNGTYTDTSFNNMACDTIFTITTIEYDAILVDVSGSGVCPGNNNGFANTTITGGVEPFEYNWSPALGNISNPSGLAPGQYFLTVTDVIGCTAVNQVVIEATARINIEYDTKETTCYDSEDGALLITSSAPGLRFSIDNVFYSSTFIFGQLGVGEYTLYIEDDSGCLHMEVFNITGPPEIILLLPLDTTINLGESIDINSIINTGNPVIYEWNPPNFLNCTDCPVVTSTPSETTVYTLEATDTMGCSAEDKMLIIVRKDRNIYIPNVFSPNLDGINDLIYIFGGVGVEEVLSFQIYDRWGEVVFAQQNFPPNDPKFGWDGVFKGETMNSGVFIYTAKIRFVDGEEMLFKGDVTLVR